MNSNPFPYYNPPTTQQQSQQQPEQQPPQSHQQQHPNQAIDQARLLQEHQQQIFLQQQRQQQPPNSHVQFQAHQIPPQYLHYQNPQQYMATPIQQTPQSQAFYAHQQMDVQNRLAHLQLQHPQQLQRSDRRTPSPTRNAPLPPTQSYPSNPNRIIVNRNTSGFSRNTLDRAEATRVKLEHLYKVSVEQAVERNQR
jgi:hypothetical protein